MEVIRINEKNYDKIVDHKPVMTIAGFYKDSLLNDVRDRDWYYVTPDDRKSLLEETNWSLRYGPDFRAMYDFDVDKAETDFVEVKIKKREEAPT